jgi:hypothetical protein
MCLPKGGKSGYKWKESGIVDESKGMNRKWRKPIIHLETGSEQEILFFFQLYQIPERVKLSVSETTPTFGIRQEKRKLTNQSDFILGDISIQYNVD